MPRDNKATTYFNRRQQATDALADVLVEHRLYEDRDSTAVAKALKIIGYEIRRCPEFPVAIVLHEELVKRGIAKAVPQ